MKRVLVDKSLYDELVDLLVAKTRTLKVGDPASEDTDVGPLITEAAAIRVEAQVNRAVADGATILVGGARRGNFYEPTILTGVRRGTPTYDEEICNKQHPWK